MQEERALLLAYGASVPEYSPLQGGHIQCEEQRLLLGCIVPGAKLLRPPAAVVVDGCSWIASL